MRTSIHTLTIGLALIFLSSCATGPFDMNADRRATQLAHDVYFDLTDNSPEACQKLVDACFDRLSGIDGIAYFAAGTRVADLDRDVNVVDYDVSLHVHFVDRAAHDAYQVAPDHLAFVAENLDNWRGVRVFDSNTAGR